MMLSKVDLLMLSNKAREAACEAGRVINEYVGRDIPVAEKKMGSSRSSQVVTEVDLKSQEIILKFVDETRNQYDLGLLAEESTDDGSRFEKEFFWCIDPLDGTVPFIEARPGYAVSMALVSRTGEPYIGVVYDPREKILYHAVKGVGAFRDEKVWDWKPGGGESFETIDRGGAVMNACWVLDNASACFYKQPKPEEGGGCLWDYAATACIFRELGAWVSDIHGDPLDLNAKDSLFMNRCGVLFASNDTIAQEVMRRVKSTP